MDNEHNALYIGISPSQKDDDNKPLLKIGKTNKPIQNRMRDLSRATGVSSPFTCVFLFKCKDPKWTEGQVHKDLDFFRWKKGEFFTCSLALAIEAILKYDGEIAEIPDSIDAEKLSSITKNTNGKSKNNSIILNDKSTIRNKVISLFKKGYNQNEISKDLKIEAKYAEKIIDQHKESLGFVKSNFVL